MSFFLASFRGFFFPPIFLCVCVLLQVNRCLHPWGAGGRKKSPQACKTHQSAIFPHRWITFPKLIGCLVGLMPWFCWLNFEREHEGGVGRDLIMSCCGTSLHFIPYPLIISTPLTPKLHDRKETCARSGMPYVNTVNKSIVPRKGNRRPPCTRTPASCWCGRGNGDPWRREGVSVSIKLLCLKHPMF